MKLLDPRERALRDARLRYKELADQKREKVMRGERFNDEAQLTRAIDDIALAAATPRLVPCSICGLVLNLDSDLHAILGVVQVARFNWPGKPDMEHYPQVLETLFCATCVARPESHWSSQDVR